MMNDQFLKIVQAEEDGLLKYIIAIDDKETSHGPPTYFDEIKQLYHRVSHGKCMYALLSIHFINGLFL